MSEPFDAENYSTLEHMRSGDWYLPKGNEPGEIRLKAARILRKINDVDDELRQQDLLKELLWEYTPFAAEVEAPIYVQYGVNTSIGQGSRIQTNVTIQDSARVTIKDRVTIATNCQLYTAMPPVNDPEMRSFGWKKALPIVIEDDVWLGPGCIVLPGVTIGKCSVIAAGTVVDRDVPPFSIASGNPVRVTMAVNPADSERGELPSGVPVDPGTKHDS